MEANFNAPSAKFGLAGFICGAVALAIVMIHLSSFFAEPEQSAGSVIGEIAADIRAAAIGKLRGDPPIAPEPTGPNYAFVFLTAAMVLATSATILGAIGLFRREPRSLPLLAIGFGTAAYVTHFAIWLALLICGVLLLVAIINNIESILGG